MSLFLIIMIRIPNKLVHLSLTTLFTLMVFKVVQTMTLVPTNDQLVK